MLHPCKADNSYDQIGQLIEDDAEFISHIEWNTQNKIKRVVRALPDLIAAPSGNVYRSDLEFVYDPLGNRVAKIEKPRDSNGDVKSQLFWIYTLYVRDATGNTLATYSRSFETPQGDDPIDHLAVQAHEIYGSKRLGTSRVGVHMQREFEINTMTTSSYHAGNQSYSTEEIFGSVTYFTNQVPAPSNRFTHVLGRKQYELSNHLGNVFATISDAKTPKGAAGNGQALGYAARIVNLQDYYPFGMLQPGRQFSEEGYGYGYQGSMSDNEFSGAGNSYTTYYRQLDTRIGRWLSVDPKTSEMPWQSPYLSMDGNPIFQNDVLGDKVRGGLRAMYKFYKYRSDLRDLRNDALRDGNTARIVDINNQLQAIKTMKKSEIIYFIKTKSFPTSKISPAGSRNFVEVDQRRTAFFGKREGRIVLTINSGDNYHVGLATAISKVDLFEHRMLDFSTNPGKPFTAYEGHSFDSQDIGELSRSQSIWEFKTNEEVARQDRIQSDILQAQEQGLDPNQRTLNSNAGDNDDQRPFDKDRTGEYTREDNITGRTHGSWVKGEKGVELIKGKR